MTSPSALDPRPFPPGEYGVVVVGSGPGGLQVSYYLSRLGIDHAVGGGMDDERGVRARGGEVGGRGLFQGRADVLADRGFHPRKDGAGGDGVRQ